MKSGLPPENSKATILPGRTTHIKPPDMTDLEPPDTTGLGPTSAIDLGPADKSEATIPLGHLGPADIFEAVIPLELTTYLEPADKSEDVLPPGLASYLGSPNFATELHEKVLEYVVEDLPVEVYLTDRNRFAHMNSRAELLPPVLFINKFVCLVGILTFFRHTKFILDGRENSWKANHEAVTVPAVRAKFIKFVADLSKTLDSGGDSIQHAIRKLSFQDVNELRQETIPVAIFCKEFGNLQEVELEIFFPEVLDKRGRRPLPASDVLLNLKLDDVFFLRNIRRLVICLKVPILSIPPDMAENRVHKVSKFAGELQSTLVERLKKGVKAVVIVDKQQEW